MSIQLWELHLLKAMHRCFLPLNSVCFVWFVCERMIFDLFRRPPNAICGSSWLKSQHEASEPFPSSAGAVWLFPPSWRRCCQNMPKRWASVQQCSTGCFMCRESEIRMIFGNLKSLIHSNFVHIYHSHSDSRGWHVVFHCPSAAYLGTVPICSVSPWHCDDCHDIVVTPKYTALWRCDGVAMAVLTVHLRTVTAPAREAISRPALAAQPISWWRLCRTTWRKKRRGPAETTCFRFVSFRFVFRMMPYGDLDYVRAFQADLFWWQKYVEFAMPDLAHWNLCTSPDRAVSVPSFCLEDLHLLSGDTEPAKKPPESKKMLETW